MIWQTSVCLFYYESNRSTVRFLFLSNFHWCQISSVLTVHIVSFPSIRQILWELQKAMSCELRLRKFLWELRAAPVAYVHKGAVTKFDISIKIQYNIWGIIIYILRAENLTSCENCVIIPKKLCGRSSLSSHGLVTVLTITGRAQTKRDASLRPRLNYYLLITQGCKP